MYTRLSIDSQDCDSIDIKLNGRILNIIIWKGLDNLTLKLNKNILLSLLGKLKEEDNLDIDEKLVFGNLPIRR